MSLSSLPLRLFSAALLATTLTACRTGTHVARMDVSQTADISGNWNDTDAKLVADTMIKQALNTPWVTRFMQQKAGKTPTVIVGRITNRSSEHINVNVFMNRLENAFTNSGAVDVVTSGAARDEARAERVDQQGNATADTRARMRAETGADFILQGEINTVIDQEGGVAVKFYQVDLRLTNMETNVRSWVGSYQIKKMVQRSRIRS
jgi:penicillin-binding protein activator